MFKKAKALVVATAITATTIVSLSPNANAVNGNIYDSSEYPFINIDLGWGNRNQVEATNYCRNNLGSYRTYINTIPYIQTLPPVFKGNPWG